MDNGILYLDHSNKMYSGPGLIDLQVNGICGIDFNDPALSEKEVLTATRYLLSRGVTTFFPTLITTKDENIFSLLHTLRQACKSYPVVRDAIGGIHLEGPFISKHEGARGAHNPKYVKPPSWELIERFQKEADGMIKLITLAPEWEGSCDFIGECRKNNILVSIGHSMADSRQIEQAVNAGMTLSTHLGNGVPLLLKRHPNMIWDQLANDDLYSMMITDGLHIPDSFIKIVMKVKAERTILVSDVTRFAGMPPGEYESSIGGRVILDSNNRLSLKGSGGLLAGAAKSLLQDIETLVAHGLATLEQAWEMASVNVTGMLGEYFPEFRKADGNEIQFKVERNKIEIYKVIKNEQVLFEKAIAK